MSNKGNPATESLLLGSLTETYWDAVTREVCGMILFFNEIFGRPESYPLLQDDMVQLEGENFKKMFELWSQLSL
jgi:hypothetical protein